MCLISSVFLNCTECWPFYLSSSQNVLGEVFCHSCYCNFTTKSFLVSEKCTSMFWKWSFKRMMPSQIINCSSPGDFEVWLEHREKARISLTYINFHGLYIFPASYFSDISQHCICTKQAKFWGGYLFIKINCFSLNWVVTVVLFLLFVWQLLKCFKILCWKYIIVATIIKTITVCNALLWAFDMKSFHLTLRKSNEDDIPIIIPKGGKKSESEARKILQWVGHFPAGSQSGFNTQHPYGF